MPQAEAKGLWGGANLNEAVNFHLKAIFIAIPKTGTTSIRTQIMPRGPALFPQPHLDIRQIRDLFYPFMLQVSLGRNASFPTERTVPSDDEVRSWSRKVYDECFKFSAVRNPWARAVSLYFRKEGVMVADKRDFASFIADHRYASDTCLYPTRHGCQVDWLKDENGRIVLDYVYKVEEMDQALDRIRELTNGRVSLQLRHENRNESSRANSYRDMFDDETRRLIARRFEEDVDTFGYTF